MNISEIFVLFEPFGDRENLPKEKNTEIQILELAKEPAMYGLKNVGVLFLLILAPLGEGIPILALIVSVILGIYKLKDFLAKSKELKAEAVSEVSEKSWDADSPKGFLIDLQGDNLFNRGFAQILSLAKIAYIIATVLCILISVVGLFNFPPLSAVIIIPVWGYICVSIIYDADQTVREDFDTSSKGATGKLYNVDTARITGITR